MRLSNWLPLLLLAAARADDDDDACSGTYTLSGQDIRLKTAPLGAAAMAVISLMMPLLVGINVSPAPLFRDKVIKLRY